MLPSQGREGSSILLSRSISSAAVAKLADAQGLGPCGVKSLGVRFSLAAPLEKMIESKPMRLNKKFFLLLIPILIIGFIVYKSKTAGIPVTVTTVKRGEVKQTVSASGDITSNQTASLSFPTSTQITEILVNEGDTTTKGQILVKGNSSSEYNSYTQSLNALEQAKSNLNSFKEQYKSDPDTIGVYNEKIYWDKYNYYQEAISSAQAQVNQSAKSLGDKTIRAPFNGIITKIYYKAQEIASATSPVIVIANPHELYFSAEIDEGDYGKIAHGQTVTIDLDSYPENKFTGSVMELTNFAQKNASGNTVFKIKIKLPEELLAKASVGMHGDIEIATSIKTDVLYLDSTSILTENDKKFVFKLEGGKAIKREITVGLETDLDTEVLAEVAENDTIIYPKNGTVKDGIRVIVIR